METAKVINDGQEQTIRLPKDFRLDDDEFLIRRLGKMIMLVPKEESWNIFLEGLNGFTDDFLPNGREPQGTLDEREPL